MLLNVKSDFGSEDGGTLHAQCVLHPDSGHARLSKVSVVSAQSKCLLRCMHSVRTKAGSRNPYACMHMYAWWMHIWKYVCAL